MKRPGASHAGGCLPGRLRMRVLVQAATRPEAADGLKAMAANGMQWFDRALEGRTWLAGDRFTLADILLYCFLEFGTTVGQPIADDLANLKAWYDRVAARPSAAA